MNERSLMLVLWAGALIVLVLAVGMTGKSFSGLGEQSLSGGLKWHLY